jgi:uncharacterized protein
MNRLSKEKSPYLLQHKNNPVDWFPWGNEAFEKAKKEDKPIFLSIGYSTCHWCHVMEHESFEDPQVAQLMNKNFVNIKVDREERPDIDHLYMTVCQMMTGSGGWPLTIVMTPDQKPFFAGTYFPKEARFGRIGMIELIGRFDELWNKQREKATGSAEQVTSFIIDSYKAEAASDSSIDESHLRESLSILKNNFDSELGGFGEAPKFPSPHNLMFLLRAWKRFHDADTLRMVERTLLAMRAGGIYDQIGFGFHRYSVDREWLVPHFEKMLYDQALLTMAYLEAFQATGRDDYAKTARETIEYVLRDLRDKDGGFFSAEDADSEGVEGKFYIWSWAELKELLGEQKLELVREIFNAEPSGNFTDMGHANPDNILHLAAGDLQRLNEPVLQEIREILFKHRTQRVRPHLDDKVLADWNGLMIAALAKAAQVLDDENKVILGAAKEAFNFVMSKMTDQSGRLFHRYREGEAAVKGVLDDYAFMSWAALELYQCTFESEYLKAALKLAEQAYDFFWDQKHGAFFFSPHDGEQLIVRKKEIYDGATPSGNSVLYWNYLRLSRLTGQTRFEERARRMEIALATEIKRYLPGHSMFLLGSDFGLGPSLEVVVTGPSESNDAKAFLDTVSMKFSPNRVLIFRPSDRADAITEIAPFTSELKPLGGKSTVYVCSNFTCDKPTTDLSEALARC